MTAQPPSDRITTVSIELIDRIDALLPQTQCGLCKTDGCRPYAEAIASGTAINHCVPGGDATVAALAKLLNRPTLALDPDYGITPVHRLVAFIREDECIGCTKCIQACPVDAIVGAAKLMHTVLVEECTGCNLCVPPCPVDCIDLVNGLDIPLTWHPPLSPAHIVSSTSLALAKIRADAARQRFLARNQRLAIATQRAAQRKVAKKPAEVSTKTASNESTAASLSAAERSALMIAAAMARSQLKKIEKQIAALEARSADSAALREQLPALTAAATQAQLALDQAQR